MPLTRRTFLRTGLAGGALLACAGWLNAAGARALKSDEREMLAAIAGVLLAGALPPSGAPRRQAIARTVDGIATAVAGLSAATQKEVGELFGLLVLAPARHLLAGVAAPWSEAAPGEIADFLESWRNSRLGLLQSGYLALHDLTFGAWYAHPESWAAIGYPGPPEVF
ncbi:MAG: hypothetical protein BGO63_14790 [Candidatus Accumulibacter sp. 66-26]|nr:hypothetical protein [Accumulibacter sp.]OJW48614.1 MAG: hypothetical protein BGO63_14790 [Candidatus Accumulibacter sp. 66-26]